MIHFIIYILIFISHPLLALSQKDLVNIGDKIWYNECGKKLEGLTHWKEGENFASLGIGHFIWYPQNHRESFQETFPSLLRFFYEKNIEIPTWLRQTPPCPWNSRAEFDADFHSARMHQLRQFLYTTRALQTLFMVEQLERVLPLMLAAIPISQRSKITHLFSTLHADKYGLYALIDYLNFKGSGISEQERYQGKGWGLLQVLQAMPETTTHPLEDFILKAKDLLTQRVKNAPQEREEGRWLKGWLARLDAYLDTSW